MAPSCVGALHAPNSMHAEWTDRVLVQSMLSTPFFPHEPIRTDGPSCLACARHARYMLRHAAVAIPPISQPMHCASVAGRAHTLAIWVAFGGVVGDSSRRDWPSGLLLAPLRACQVHRFPPRGPSRVTRAAPLLPFGVGCVVATQLRTGECGAAVGGAWGA